MRIQVVLLLLCACLGLQAQSFTSLNMGQWVNGKFIYGERDTDGYKVFDFEEGLVYHQSLPYAPLPKGQPYPRETNRITFVDGEARLPKLSDGRIGQANVFFTDGNAYTTVWGGEPRALELLSYIDGEWISSAVLDTRAQGVILPLRNDNYLVGLRGGHQIDGNKPDPNPFGIYRKNSKGALELLSMIDLNFTFDKVNLSQVSVDLAQTTRHFAITDSHYTYINADIGIMWTFSKSNGRLVRTKTLYPRVVDGWTRWTVPVVIWAQPTYDDHILISAWSDKLCIEGAEIMRKRSEYMRNARLNLGSKPSEEQKIMEEMEKTEAKFLDSLVAIDPIVRWYRYNPADGQLVREHLSPIGGNPFIQSREDYLEFRHWLINGDGTEMYYVDHNLVMSRPKTKNKITEVAKQFSIGNLTNKEKKN